MYVLSDNAYQLDNYYLYIVIFFFSRFSVFVFYLVLQLIWFFIKDKTKY